jgi:hypothetical protein
LLERLRFLSISGNNLDEFFMVRVAGLKAHRLLGVEETSVDGLTPAQQLAAVAEEADRLTASQQAVWEELRTALAAEGVRVIGGEPLDGEAEAFLERHFREQIFPVLTPQALDPAHPFPFIPNRGFSLIFDLRRPGGDTIRELLMVPATLPRFVRIPGAEARFIAMETLIRRNIATLFPGSPGGEGAFRIIRDSDIEVEEEAEDLVRYFRSAIKRRRRGRVIRLKLEAGMPDELVDLVKEGVGAADAIVTESTGFLGIADLGALYEEDRPDLKFAPFTPRFPERIREHGGDCFAAIQSKDIVVHHPYESFEVVVEFLKQAAADPDVVAIKQTLYRAGKQSAIIRALIDAAEAGKSVTAVVELKARFDEEQNLLWASRSSGRACRSSTASSTGRPTPRSRWSSAARRRATAPTAISAPAIITRSPRASTPISASSPPIRAYRPRRGAIVQLHHRLCRAARARASHHVAARASRLAARPDRDRDDQRPRRPARRDLGEDERAGRPDRHRQALRGERGRGGDRPRRSRHLLPAAGSPGPVRERSGSSRSSAGSSSTAASGASAMATSCPTGRRGSISARPTGCRAISTGGSSSCCRSRTRPSTPRCSTR